MRLYVNHLEYLLPSVVARLLRKQFACPYLHSICISESLFTEIHSAEQALIAVAQIRAQTIMHYDLVSLDMQRVVKSITNIQF